MTNVAGPPVPLYLGGAPLLEVFPVLPVMGNLTLVVGALSYAGQLNLTAVGDPDGCPDVEEFAQGVRDALDDLVSHAHVDPADGLIPGARPRKGATHVPASLA